MTNLTGEYKCKVDAKGRISFPASLKKQLGEAVDFGFAVKRSVFETCLELYPLKEWEKITHDIFKLNRFVRKNDAFIRRFTAGVTHTELDGVGRLLVPRNLADTAGLGKEIVLFASGNRIELWDSDTYELWLKNEVGDFGGLAEEVMGGINPDPDNGSVS
ncbi:MAG: division/cell wall cluster transcriptional repressor MraZ [Bacteroidetes bacterium]|nr:division/cell wall cluster transcriptional repressor MraZ [Bacteroidota bacterium]MBU1718474.1 division/cell wall cluster transcriptional repressor MraZ [Bacteroidota bacterium]